ncbi:MAG: agmatine deiminase family protein, partial [Acidiferrobacterales bacterium]|nr:agmatine deiminase family protein [Acidiferrobacterales bacterium]
MSKETSYREGAIDTLPRTRVPAEWEPQSGAMLTWPHEHSDWASLLPEVEAIYLVLAREISARQRLLIVCFDDEHLDAVHQRLLANGVNERNVRLYVAPSNDTWARDHGPITVGLNGELQLLDFHFNGWGGKYPHELDDAITRRLYRAGAFGEIRLDAIDLVAEGGAIEFDGAGTMLATARSLLTVSRNRGLTQSALERRLNKCLGVERFLWLRHGGIAGDDTDGHIDTLARFCDPGTIAYVGCTRKADPHHADLEAMANELSVFRTSAGNPYRLVPLPSPAPIYDRHGRQLPA